MFPNSVLKQRANTTSDVEVYFEEYDIELEFNSRAHWYFGKEGEAVPQNMLDFECIILLTRCCCS